MLDGLGAGRTGPPWQNGVWPRVCHKFMRKGSLDGNGGVAGLLIVCAYAKLLLVYNHG